MLVQVALIHLATFVTLTHSVAYVGCGNAEGEIEVVANNIYACRGTFAKDSGSVFGAEAESLCGSRYSICKSATAAAELGLTDALCTSTAIFSTARQFFGTQETSDGGWACYTKTGRNYEDRNRYNDIWGCGNIAGMSATNANAVCPVGANTIFKYAIGNGNSDNWKIDTSVSLWSEMEAKIYYLTDASSGGVLCCATDAVECPVDETKTFNWETLTSDGTDIPVADFTMKVIDGDLSLNIEVEVDYIVLATADDQPDPNFGTTYVLDFEDFDAHKSSISKPGSCSNRLAGDYGQDSNTYFTVHSDGINAIGTIDNMCYPPPGDDTTGWSINTDGMCTKVKYSGKWTWGQLRECKNGAVKQTFILGENDANYDPDYLSLSGTFYINMVSPFWYKTYTSQLVDYYRVYQLVSQPFIIQVSKSVYVIGQTGVNVMTMSVIAVYKEDQDTDYTLILLTEAAEYMELTSGEIIQVPTSNQFSLVMQSTSESNGCLSNKAYLCSQLWKISAKETTCDSNRDDNGAGGISFSGDYSLRFTPQCRANIGAHAYDSLKHCNEWLDAHPIYKNDNNHGNGEKEGVALSTQLTFVDGICQTRTFTVQLAASMKFYEDDEYKVYIDPETSTHLYEVGEDTVYGKIKLVFPTDTEKIFDSTLVNVWLCTFPPDTDVPAPDQNGQSGGCFSDLRDGANNGDNFFFHVYRSTDPIINEEDFVVKENGNEGNDVIRFAFTVPNEIERDTLYIHAQIEVLLEQGVRRRTLLRVFAHSKTTNKISHFGQNIGVTNKRGNEPKQPEIPPQQPLQQPPSMVEPFTISLNSAWVLVIGALLAIILTLNIIFMCYMNCCKSTNGRPRISFSKNRRSGYDSVKHVDSEEFDDSEANLINVN